MDNITAAPSSFIQRKLHPKVLTRSGCREISHLLPSLSPSLSFPPPLSVSHFLSFALPFLPYSTCRHMLEPVRPEALLPDRALCLPTFSHFLIVIILRVILLELLNKTSLSLSLLCMYKHMYSLSLSLSLSHTHTHMFICRSRHALRISCRERRTCTSSSLRSKLLLLGSTAGVLGVFRLPRHAVLPGTRYRAPGMGLFRPNVIFSEPFLARMGDIFRTQTKTEALVGSGRGKVCWLRWCAFPTSAHV